METPTDNMVNGENGNKWTAITLLCFFLVFGAVAFLLYKDMDRINHRLDVRDAYFNKGLIEAGKSAQDAYKEERRRNLEILEHCRINPCNLPTTLAIPRQEVALKSIETILMEENK